MDIYNPAHWLAIGELVFYVFVLPSLALVAFAMAVESICPLK